MNYQYFNLKSSVLPFILSLLFLLPGYVAPAQTFYLKEYVLGNSYAPNNRSFTFEASKYCPYNWSIRTIRTDYLGGEIELHAAPGTKPDCKSIYRIIWAFSKDMRTVSCGEKVFIDITNRPISKADCGIFVWEGDNNPSSITLLASTGVGESSLVYETEIKDPGASYRDYVFNHYPARAVQGEPLTANYTSDYVHQARWELVVCSRADMAANANGGSFTFRLGNRGISFDVVYLYTKAASVMANPVASLQNPVIQHNLQNAEGTYWMSIQVPGSLQGYGGKQIYVVIRFVDAQGNLIPGGHPSLGYIDTNGYAAAGSGLVNVPSDNFDLGALQIWMPYYALNLPYSAGQQAHDLSTYAEVIVDGETVAKSQLVPLRVTW
ncbi:MAG: hypothetical protein ACI8P3_002298 [Saprospiraceae bacterium]|jgi:hypothetical protein